MVLVVALMLVLVGALLLRSALTDRSPAELLRPYLSGGAA